MTLSFPGSTKKKKKDTEFEEKAEIVENPEMLEKKKKYPGLCIPDDPMRAKDLIIPEEDSKEAQKTMDEVRHYYEERQYRVLFIAGSSDV